MRLPETITERMPVLETLEDDWQPVPRVALWAWLVFYAAFLFQLIRGGGLPPLMDNVFVPIHEGGHLLFRFFGEFISVAGGTILQLLVPFLLSAYFVFRRQPQAVAFCSFFMFEQLLPVATYMADARAQQLPLLSVGGGDDVIHDWNYLFGHLGVLPHDAPIAAITRLLGWCGMLGVVLWLLWRGLNDVPQAKPSTAR